MKIALDTLGVKKFKEKEIRSRYAAMMEQVAAPYSETEQKTWPTQVKEADQWLADPTANVPLITLLAQNRNVAMADLVVWIKENDSLFRQAIGTLLGLQQAELDALNAKK